MKKNHIIALIIVFCVMLVYFSTFIADEREIIIVTRFGKIVRVIDQAGLYLKLPAFLNTINRFDKRIELLKTETIQLLLKDKNPIVLTSFACWKIDSPLTFFQSLTNKDIAVQRLSDMIVSVLGNVLGEYNMDNFINVDAEKVKLEEIELKVLKDCNQKAKTKYGITIISFGIQHMNYPSIVLESIYSRMQSERDKEAQKYRSEGMEEYTKIKSGAEREASKIESEAYKKAEIIKGEGDKKATEIYAKAHNKSPEFYEFLRSLDVYDEVLKGKTTLILSTDSDIFKYLNYKENGVK